MTSRRLFCVQGLRRTTLLALAPSLPGFLARTARAVAPARDGRILVVVQLDGGNDGLNTVVPIGDDAYARHRKTLRLPESRLIAVDRTAGLHPAMGDAGKLLESGRLAIVPGAGYPNPSRSHFQSMEIWQSARFDPRDRDGTGWIGRSLDAAPPPTAGAPAALLMGTEAIPPALRGRRSTCAALDRLEDYAVADRGRVDPGGPGDDLGSFLRRSTLDAYATADRLDAVAHAPDARAAYPAGQLAARLQLTARLIKAGLGTRVYYASQGGYDTHNQQLPQHARLLGEFAAALGAFLDDLDASGLGDRVLVLAFSEFGRRVAENASAGTDHGTAGPVFLAGSGVRPGIHGGMPSLADLDDGDLRATVDFRRIYATILGGWLDLSAAAALGGEFPPLPLLRDRG